MILLFLRTYSQQLPCLKGSPLWQWETEFSMLGVGIMMLGAFRSFQDNVLF